MSATDPVLHAAAATCHPYQIVACDPGLADTAAFCEAYGYRLDQSANAIVIVGKPDQKIYVACLILATTRLDVNGTVRKKIGVKKASFATADETRGMTGMEIGGVTPFGLPAGMPLWIDRRIMDAEYVDRRRRLARSKASCPASVPGWPPRSGGRRRSGQTRAIATRHEAAGGALQPSAWPRAK